jgi:hypothetical protein
MPRNEQRLKRFSSPDNREQLPLHELLQLSESGRSEIRSCYEIQAAREHKPLLWVDRLDWEHIDNIRMRYFNSRASEVTSTRADEEFDGTAILVRDACAKLIEATERKDYSTDQLWTMLAVGHPDLERAHIRVLIEALRNRTEQFDRLVMKANFRRIRIGEARSTLIAQLAEHFRGKKLKPAASVNYGEGANP